MKEPMIWEPYLNQQAVATGVWRSAGSKLITTFSCLKHGYHSPNQQDSIIFHNLSEEHISVGATGVPCQAPLQPGQSPLPHTLHDSSPHSSFLWAVYLKASITSRWLCAHYSRYLRNAIPKFCNIWCIQSYGHYVRQTCNPMGKTLNPTKNPKP